MQSFLTQLCVHCDNTRNTVRFISKPLAMGHWLISRIHRGCNCDNTTVTSFDKLTCIIITALCTQTCFVYGISSPVHRNNKESFAAGALSVCFSLITLQRLPIPSTIINVTSSIEKRVSVEKLKFTPIYEGFLPITHSPTK